MPTVFKDFFFHVGAIIVASIAALITQGILEFLIPQFRNSDFNVLFFSFIGLFVCWGIVVLVYLDTPEGKHFRLYSIGLAAAKPMKQPEPENVVILIDAKDHVRDVSPSAPQSSSQPSSLSPAAQKIAD